jgi:RNA polymerase sigma factor (sigma-70 family)
LSNTAATSDIFLDFAAAREAALNELASAGVPLVDEQGRKLSFSDVVASLPKPLPALVLRAVTLRNKIVEKNAGLVKKHVNGQEYRTSMQFECTEEDLKQGGMIGLVRAVDLFDPTVGVKFSSYAMFWVRNGMQDVMQRAGHPTYCQPNNRRSFVSLAVSQRKESVRRHGSGRGNDEVSLEEVIPDHSPSPHAKLEESHQMRELAKALDQLPLLQADKIAIEYFEVKENSFMIERRVAARRRGTRGRQQGALDALRRILGEGFNE